MAEKSASVTRLILVPAAITLAVTILRLAGELEGWSKTFFNPDAGGAMAIVGIVWLAPLFGAYFAMKLARSGEGPESAGRAVGFAAAGFLLMLGGFLLFQFVFHQHIRYLLVLWGMAAAGALLQLFAWPELFKVLVAYAYAARIPVAIVMFIATDNVWSSHYNALTYPEHEMGEMLQYAVFGLIPQLVWWVSFTIIVGALLGGLMATLIGHPKPALSK